MKRIGAYHQLVYHFVWSTRNRSPLLTPTVEAKLLPYIAHKCKELNYQFHAVNGVENHLHLLVSLTPMMVVADVAKNIKGSSSHFINKLSGLSETFYWQDGYGVVTIRHAEIPKVVRYIKRQKEHHQEKTLSEILERTEI